MSDASISATPLRQIKLNGKTVSIATVGPVPAATKRIAAAQSGHQRLSRAIREWSLSTAILSHLRPLRATHRTRQERHERNFQSPTRICATRSFFGRASEAQQKAAVELRTRRRLLTRARYVARQLMWPPVLNKQLLLAWITNGPHFIVRIKRQRRASVVWTSSALSRRCSSTVDVLSRSNRG